HVASLTSDPTPGNHDGSASTFVVSDLADLTITKSISDPNPPPGGLLTYTITVTNHGPSDTTDTVVSDSVPAGTSFSSVLASGLSCVGPTNGDVRCSGLLATGASATVTFVVVVPSSATPGTSITNTATTSASPLDPHTA